MPRKNILSLVACGLIFTLLTACGKTTTTSNVTAIDNYNTPATLVVFGLSGDSEDSFNKFFGDDIRKKFPTYTIQYLQASKDNNLQNLLSTGQQIDLIYTSIGLFPQIADLGDQFDMTDLAKKHHVDLSQFEPAALQAIQNYGGLYGLPTSLGGLVLYYNKDLFDKFGVHYPTDGMTWDQAVELGKQMTRVDSDGVQYVGLDASSGHFMKLNPFSVPLVDKKTLQSTLDNDKWREMVKTIFLNPTQNLSDQSVLAKVGNYGNNNPFMKDKIVAMYVMNHGLQPKDFNWDEVALPTFKEKPGVGTQPYPNFMFMSGTSQYKDQAMEVLKYLTSEEHEIFLAQNGLAPAIKSQAAKDALNNQSGDLKGKNFKNALFFNKFADPATITDYDGQTLTGLTGIVKDLQAGKVDINTAFSQALEAANKGIAAQKSQK